MISWETPFGRQNIKGFCDPGSLGSHGIFIKSFPPSPLQVTQPQTACRGMAGVTESEWKWNSTTSDLDFLWTLIWTRNNLLKCDSRGLSGARDSTTFHHVEQKVTRASRPRELSFRKGIPSSNERCGGNSAACRAAEAACRAAEAACRAAEVACDAAEAAAGKFSMVRNVPPRRGKL